MTRNALLAVATVATLLAAVLVAEQRLLNTGQPLAIQTAAKSADAGVPGDAAFEPWQGCCRICRLPDDSPCFDHYRADFVADPQGARLGLFLPRFVGSVRVRLNGVQVAEFGSITPPVRHLIYLPGFAELPQELVLAENRLTFSVTGANGRFFRLHQPYIGPFSELRGANTLMQLLAHDALVVSCGVYLLLGLFAWLLYRYAAGGATCLWFAGICLAALLRSSFFLVHEPGLAAVLNALYFSATLMLSAAVLGFTVSLRGRATRWYLWFTLCCAVVGAGLAAYAAGTPVPGEVRANLFVQYFVVPVSAFTLFHLLAHLRAAPSPSSPWVLALFLGAAAAVLHDLWPTFVTREVLLLQLSALSPLLMVLAFCVLLVDRVASSFQAVTLERQRIMRDMHDGVAGRLAGLVIQARREQRDVLATQLESSIDDMRLIIESLDDHPESDLRSTLVRFSEQAAFTLTGAGIASRWHGVATLPRKKVAPGWRLNLLRILQEALNNTMRHAGAGAVDVVVEASSSRLRIALRDDGVGLAAERARPAGRGLENMAARARELGGTATIADRGALGEAPAGTRVVIEVPLATPEFLGVTEPAVTL